MKQDLFSQNVWMRALALYTLTRDDLKDTQILKQAIQLLDDKTIIDIPDHITNKEEFQLKKYLENNLIENSCNAYFMSTGLNRWVGNYWDDWDGTIPYTIKGVEYKFIGFDEYGYPIWDWVEDYEYDYSPAEEPYDITTKQEYNINGNFGNIDNTMIERFPLLERLLNLGFCEGA